MSLQTPLNNNIRELFNLMNFLDPDQWADLEALEKEFEELDEERIKDMHERLRPYFLRRVKADVLDLPPKVSTLGILRIMSSHGIFRMRSLFRYPWPRFRKKSINRSSVRRLY